eukprot:3198141-Prymnesium_polylepis.1
MRPLRVEPKQRSAAAVLRGRARARPFDGQLRDGRRLDPVEPQLRREPLSVRRLVGRLVVGVAVARVV